MAQNFADLAHHFDENASLDDPLRQEILDYYVAQASRSTQESARLCVSRSSAGG